MGLLQPRLPLKKNGIHGPYSSFEEEEVAQSLHQDLEILLKTIPGEWPMRPDLGVGIQKFLFESPTDPDFLVVKNKIKTQVKKYLPTIQITNVQIRTDPDLIDVNQAYITVEYYITSLKIASSMNIYADGWSQSDDLIHRALQARKQSALTETSF